MTPTTLQALRRLLFFSVPEAAELIGNVTERSWRFWEDGGRPVPDDVSEAILRLCEWRRQALDGAARQIAEAKAALPTDAVGGAALVWYDSLDDWKPRDPPLWRPQCSVIATLCAEHGAVAVPFDRVTYDRWRGRRADSETLRAAWAGALAEH